MINIDEKFVDKVLEDIPSWLQILRCKKSITLYEITLLQKIISNAENIIFDNKEKKE